MRQLLLLRRLSVYTYQTRPPSQLALFAMYNSEGWADSPSILTKSAWWTRFVRTRQLLSLIKVTVYTYPNRLVNKSVVYAEQLLRLRWVFVYTYQVHLVNSCCLYETTLKVDEAHLSIHTWGQLSINVLTLGALHNFGYVHGCSIKSI